MKRICNLQICQLRGESHSRDFWRNAKRGNPRLNIEFALPASLIL